jgi:dTDP-4-dehydrorhamnose 3,5-epimerase
MPFTFQKLAIPGVLLVEPHIVSDPRGFFMETYKRSAFAAAGIDEVFVQENHSRSERGVLRGLHYQEPPYAQSKLIRVLSGEIFDVAVDLRSDAPTGGRWVGVRLSSANRRMVYLPQWCAHGFCVVSDQAEVVYMTTTEYAPAHESGFMWNDPGLAIDWPVASPTISERDRKWPPFALQALKRSEP